MIRMKRALFLLLSFVLLLPVSNGLVSGQGSTGGATIYRDEFGIPHVFAPNLELASFAVGYAQAEDRLEELLKNYRRANGRMAEVFGSEFYRSDVIQRMWRHEAISREKYNQVSPELRKAIEAYQEGIKLYMREHPKDVPSWAQEINPWDVISLGRYIIFGWPLGEAAGDLQRGGIQPDPMVYRGSNEMLISPARTAIGAPIAIIDPHLSWYGEFRFYQIRMYAGDYNVAGVSILGVPFPSLGHSRYCSIAMTTGGPDTSDIYEEEISPANPRQYKYDGQWREMKVVKEKIGVKDGDKVNWKEIEIEYSHHGPVVARKEGKAYTMAIPYAESVGLTDQIHEMMKARNLNEMKKALSKLELMSQNIMIGTVQGDIYYLRTGKVPIRPAGVDPGKPIPGNTSATEWRGLHPLEDLVQVTNPPQGYMHNCNVTPFAMMKDSPLTPEKYSERSYLYNATRTAPRHQRGEMMTDLLAESRKVTVEQAIDIAFHPQVYHAELWQARLHQAWQGAPSGSKQGEVAKVYDLISKWNRRSDAESEGALAFYAFKTALGGTDARAIDPPAAITDAQLLTALSKAVDWLKTSFGSVSIPYGQFFRVGRRGSTRTWPVGGGSIAIAGMATPRAITFAAVGKEMVGHTGQTSTQIVILTNPPQSYGVIPLGQSDIRASGHWEDQAEKLFSKSKAASSYFLDRNALMKHVTSKKVLTRSAAAAARGK